ncbi:mitochondrial amidoxime reducing component [Anticarsia gemmatalis]|uniref:mitochondrial amidoxime reducing component n=1 Tax=Anticarsia gemmatalis TaxID=129554 RepID=UPI003F76B6C2
MAVSNPVPHYVTAAVSTVGVLGGAYYAYQAYQEKKNKLPDEWKQVGYLKRLYVYPIKSCAPVLLNQGECTSLGMRVGWLRDRVLMIVDAKDNNFITARVYPELLKVQPTIKNAILTLEHPSMEKIEINLAEVMVTQKQMNATVWKAEVPVYDCGDEVNKWITKFLARPDMNFRLVYYAAQKCRPKVGAPKVFTKWRKSDTGIFPDELAFNLINEASVDDLNTRLNDVKVNETYFRPNFLLTGAQAYDEDNWKYLKIGENIFEVIKPCTRCILTTIDPETGVRNKNMDPLQTLRNYRLVEDPLVRKATGISPRMGVQLALRSGPGGQVSLNDPIYVAY